MEHLWAMITALEIEAGNAHFIHEYLRDDLNRPSVQPGDATPVAVLQDRY